MRNFKISTIKEAASEDFDLTQDTAPKGLQPPIISAKERDSEEDDNPVLETNSENLTSIKIPSRPRMRKMI